MSLYWYAIAVSSEEDAKRYVAACEWLDSRTPKFMGFNSGSPDCCDYEYENCPQGHKVLQELLDIYNDDKSICLGRPWTGEGIGAFTEKVSELNALNHYFRLGEREAGQLINIADDEQKAWLLRNAGSWVILGHDNML